MQGSDGASVSHGELYSVSAASVPTCLENYLQDSVLGCMGFVDSRSDMCKALTACIKRVLRQLQHNPSSSARPCVAYTEGCRIL